MVILVIALLQMLVPLPGVPLALAQDAGQRLTVEGMIAGGGQGGHPAEVGTLSEGRALPLTSEVSWLVNDSHRFLAKVGFAAGNGLNAASGFHLRPWAADLEDDLRQINGRNRDHLLTAWYKYATGIGDAFSVGATLGIIDATEYLDDNAFANDEYGQFMNEALINAPSAFLPSYDIGVAVEVEAARWTLRGVYMNVGENEAGSTCHFVGAQIGYRSSTSLGEGRYRLLGVTTDRQFPGPSGSGRERRAGFAVSVDQQLGSVLGAFIRLAAQDDKAAIDYGKTVSGGLELGGTLWGRPGDTIGAAYARLSEGNGDLYESRVGELYYRLALTRILAVTADMQYLMDASRPGIHDLEGWILGLRMVAEF